MKTFCKIFSRKIFKRSALIFNKITNHNQNHKNKILRIKIKKKTKKKEVNIESYY